MKQKFLSIITAAVLLLGMTGCSSVANPSSNIVDVQDQDLVGLWWDEFECNGVTEAGVTFSRALLALQTNADHTGCLYLGVFDATNDEPLAVYGGPEDAGFNWRLLPDGSVQLSDPATGESYALTRSGKGGNDSYGDDMTDVSNTKLNYAGGNMQGSNDNYSGNLAKADAKKAVDAAFAAIADALKKDDKVQLVGFGTFSTSVRAAREGINPLTKQKITIAAKKVAKFKPASELV